MTTYEKNYITQAVIQLDFDPIVTQRFLTFLWENADKGWFWHLWNKQEVRHDDIQVSDDSFTRKINKWFIRICDDRDGKRIQLTSNTLTILFDWEYKSQEIITTEFEFVNEFLKFFKIEYLNRFLVRYINEFRAKDFEDVWDWDRSEYIKDELLSNIKISKNIWEIRQWLSEATVKVEDLFLWLRYWIWNRLVPNPIVDWNFVLDIAVRSSEAIEVKDLLIGDLFKKYKDILNNVFENSITEELKSFLSPK